MARRYFLAIDEIRIRHRLSLKLRHQHARQSFVAPSRYLSQRILERAGLGLLAPFTIVVFVSVSVWIFPRFPGAHQPRCYRSGSTRPRSVLSGSARFACISTQ